MTDSRYIDCDDHGPRRKAYIVCKHVLDSMDRSRIAFHKPWTDEPDGAGELCCAIPGADHTVDDLALYCEDHLLEIGLLLPGERRLT